MILWAFLFLAFLVQEPISTSGVVLQAYQIGYNVWVIHALFVFATLVDIALGYVIGLLLARKYSHTRVAIYISRKLAKFTASLGAHGKRVALIVFAPVIFPVSSLFPPFLGISFLEAVVCLFIGEFVFWYVPVWAVILGVKSFGFDPRLSLYIVLGITTLLFLGKWHVRNRSFKK